MLWAQM